jgi:hypothetical protein
LVLTSAKDPASGPEEDENKREKTQECSYQDPDGVGIPRHYPVLKFGKESADSGRKRDSFRSSGHCHQVCNQNGQ